MLYCCGRNMVISVPSNRQSIDVLGLAPTRMRYVLSSQPGEIIV